MTKQSQLQKGQQALQPRNDLHLETSRAVHAIAIAEDDEELLSLMSMIVKSLGHRVEFLAHDGAEIVRVMTEGGIHPEIILMDYRMPQVDGLQAAREILRVSPETKVIIVTADDSVKAEADSAGLIFLQKPFSAQDLSKAINDAMRRS